MPNFCILTNNPAVHGKYPAVAVYAQTGVQGVFTAVRDRVHLGAMLISHPLSGSVKPNESPYKSVLLSQRTGPVDADSLALIEGALAVLAKLPQKQRSYSPRVLDDFRAIDLDLVNSAMLALPAQYHQQDAML